MKLRSTMTRIISTFSVPDRGALENDYLNRCNSLVDLERRQREIDRGKFRHL